MGPAARPGNLLTAGDPGGGLYFVRVGATGGETKYGNWRPVDSLEIQEPVAGGLGTASTKPVKPPGRVKELSKAKPAKLLADPR